MEGVGQTAHAAELRREIWLLTKQIDALIDQRDEARKEADYWRERAERSNEK